MKMRVLVDGETVEVSQDEVSVEVVEPGVWSVLVGGRSLEVCVHDGNAWIGGQAFEVQVHDPRELTDEAESGGPSGRRTLLAPMPGKVIRVLVEEGGEVTAGQGIVVVEAMKMQNEMPSPKAGRVVSIAVKAGDAVATGQVLAVIE
jgi:biotin carboxyl carrier protein